MLCQVGEPEDSRVRDQLAQHAAAEREVADDPAFVLVDPDGEEASECIALVVEEAERGVACAGQLLRGHQHAVKDLLELVDVEQLVEDRDKAAGCRILSAVHLVQPSSSLCSSA